MQKGNDFSSFWGERLLGMVLLVVLLAMRLLVVRLRITFVVRLWLSRSSSFSTLFGRAMRVTRLFVSRMSRLLRVSRLRVSWFLGMSWLLMLDGFHGSLNLGVSRLFGVRRFLGMRRLLGMGWLFYCLANGVSGFFMTFLVRSGLLMGSSSSSLSNRGRVLKRVEYF